MRFHAPTFAASLSLPSQAESTEEVDQQVERALEERLTANPDDTDVLHALMECKIRARIEEADRLIEVELEEYEWPLLFEEILKRDPLRVEAFHGLMMATLESNEPLRRVEEALEACKKQNKDS
uniref:Uncharacterized protein n=1 Tax=Cajanus cajan TaxID=3821 RepID=A0A151SNP9_CAJCA|nr:hypothetical protein KK1_002688 [Cajanus cajan]